MDRSTRRRILRTVAPVAGLLAAGLLVWQGSYAAFSATTTSPSNNWAAGTVSLLNSSNNYAQASGTATWSSATGLKPGSTDTKCITVKSGGSLAGVVKLYVQNVSQTNALGDNLLFTIKAATTGITATNVSAACSGFPGASTTLTGAGGTALSALPAGGYSNGYSSWTTTGVAPEYAAYQISWTVNSAAPSTVQGGTAAADFAWEVQNS